MPRIRLHLDDLPPPVPDIDVFGAIQIRNEVEQISRLTDRSMDLTAEFEISTTSAGPDFRGPYVQGRRGDRFIYISWGLCDDPDEFGMYRRAKIILDEIPVDLLDGSDLDAVIEGTARDGGPVCARVRPDAIVWTRAR